MLENSPESAPDALTIYNTEAKRAGFFPRLFPSLTFYTKAFWTVTRAAWEIRAGEHSSGAFAGYSMNVARAVLSVGSRILVENADVLRRIEGPCIIAGNHMSTLETMLLPGIIMPIRPMTFIAKQSLMKYPVFSTPLAVCDPIIVGRSNPRDDLRIMTTETHERLTRGVSVVVFPQTTRTTRFSPQHFNSIGAKLAKREKVPLIPLALKTDFWGIGKKIRDIGPINPKLAVRFRFGEPIDASTGDREANQACVDFIDATLKEWIGTEPQVG